MPVPNIMQHNAYASFPRDALFISLLNRNSCAISWGVELDQGQEKKQNISTSTKPVYSKIPALKESITPLTMDAVVLLGLYVFRIPRPAAIPTGVVMAYRKAAQ